MQRLILEIGTGNDLYGGNYTKAACRAVQDAIHHSSLILFRSLDISHEKMQVNVTVGVQESDKVDREVVARECFCRSDQGRNERGGRGTRYCFRDRHRRH